MNKEAKKSRPQNIVKWIYIAPTATQVAAYLFSGVLVPGFIGLILKNWEALTHKLWIALCSLVGIDFSGLEGPANLLTLGLMMTACAMSSPMRKTHAREKISLNAEFVTTTKWRRRLIVVRAAALAQTFVAIFSISNVLQWYEGNYLYTGAYYLISFVILICILETYFFLSARVNWDKLEKELVQEREIGNYSIKYTLALLGILSTGPFIGLGFCLFFPMEFWSFTSYSAEEARLKIWAMVIFSFLVVWLLHIRIGWPTTKKLLESANDILFFCLGFLVIAISCGGFWLGATESNQAFFGLFAIAAGTISTIAMLKVLEHQWQTLRNILIVTIVIVASDQILRGGAALIDWLTLQAT